MGSLPAPIDFSNQSYPGFDVEVADDGMDIVYHFWPESGTKDFVAGFAAFLEQAFQEILPEDADVRAAFTSREEAQILSKFGDVDAPPVPSYYVRVIGWADNPMSEKFLKNKVFRRLSTLIQTV